MTTGLHCLCSPDAGLLRQGQLLRCAHCGSFRDLRATGQRADHSGGGQALRTLQGWLRRVGLDRDLGSRVVCEVGFRDAGCLDWLRCASSRAFGIGTAEAVARAMATGLPARDLFDAARLPRQLPEPVDLWIFQDSFEHLPAPAAFCAGLVANSAPAARLLIVCPEAGSLSEAMMGSRWPHRTPGHRFHWSRRGLTGFLDSFGFTVERQFLPLKQRRCCGIGLSVTIGEMGLLLRRQ